MKNIFDDFINGKTGIEIESVSDLDLFLKICNEFGLQYDIDYISCKNSISKQNELFCYIFGKKDVFVFEARWELKARVYNIVEACDMINSYYISKNLSE